MCNFMLTDMFIGDFCGFGSENWYSEVRERHDCFGDLFLRL